MSIEYLNYKVMQKNVLPKDTIKQFDVLVMNVHTNLVGFRKELIIFKQLVMKSMNVLRKLEELVDPTEKNISTLAYCIQKQLDYFVEAEVCKTALEEGTIRNDHFNSKVKQMSVSLKESVQQQNDILFDVRISFSGIRQGITIFEEYIEKWFNVIQKTKKRMASNDKMFSVFEKDIKNRLYQVLDVYEATVEGTMSTEQSNSEVILKNFLTRDQVKLLNQMLSTYENKLFNIGKGISTSFETTEMSFGMIKKMKDRILSNEKELSNFEDGSQKPLEQLVGCEVYKSTVKGTTIAEQFDFKDRQNKVLTKEAVQIQNGKLLTVRTNFIAIRQKIALSEENMKTFNNMLQIFTEKVASEENELSIYVDGIQKQQDNLI